jgi:solute carrier family 15 (peptide/histidine transporter), member 3/4
LLHYDNPSGHFVILQAAVRNNGGLVKEAKAIIHLFPIWVACLLYAVAYSQSSTFFTKQATTLDRQIGRHFQVPPAALHSFINITIVVIIPIYDRVLVPVSRRYSSKPSGITMLQRIGTGMFLSLLSMVIAALVENQSCDLEASTWRLYPSDGRAIRCYLVDLRSI